MSQSWSPLAIAVVFLFFSVALPFSNGWNLSDRDRPEPVVQRLVPETTNVQGDKTDSNYYRYIVLVKINFDYYNNF